MTGKNQRFHLLYKNVVASFFIKGYAALIALMLVPLTIDCLGTLKNGVWLTISSVLVWINQMDIGLGNGLRNRLAIHVAHQEMEAARKAVSSTLAMLICIVTPVLCLLILLTLSTDVYAFLNITQADIPELRIALIYAITFICITFVLKFIGNVYMGLQLPAVNNLLVAFGSTLILIVTWILYINGKATFLNVVIANTAAPLIIYLIAYVYTFYHQFPQLCPSYHLVNLRSALELGNLGIKFFWIQIASVIQFMSINLLISNFFTPAMVTPYQIAYRYLNLAMVLFTIICMPFWNATTDAYERNDMEWIRKANKKMNLMILLIAAVMTLAVVVSPWVFQIWIGDSCHVPFGMTVMVALYIFLLIVSMRYSYFLNGIGALRLQLYMTIMTVLFIPMSYFVVRYTHDMLWFLGVMCFCVVPSIVVNLIQFHKFLHGTAKGIWRI